jgi:hypothetical protein
MTEAIGHLCRWALLLLGVLVLAGSVTVALVNIERSVLDRDDAPVAADTLMSPGRRQWAGLTYPSQRGRKGEVAYLARIEGVDELRRTVRYRDRDILSLQPDRRGLRRVEAIGSPYGPMALSRRSLLVKVVGPSGLLAVVDAEPLADAVGSDPLPVRRALNALGTSTDLAAGFFGQREDYAGVRAALRRADPALPVVGFLQDGPSPAEQLLGHLRRLSARLTGLRVELYTDRPELAARARGIGLSVSSLADRVASTTASPGGAESPGEGQNR